MHTKCEPDIQSANQVVEFMFVSRAVSNKVNGRRLYTLWQFILLLFSSLSLSWIYSEHKFCCGRQPQRPTQRKRSFNHFGWNFLLPPPFIWTCIFYEVVYLNHVNKPFTRFMWFGWAFYGFWYSRFLAFQFAKCTNCLFDTTNIDTFPAQDDYSAINIACSPVQVKYPSKISNTCMRTSIYSFARYSEVGMFVYIKYI